MKTMKGFWNILPKPFFILAPMADVTDAAFRKIIAKYGKPDVMFTEFTSADGLFLGGREPLMKNLLFTEEERPIVAQFFTSKPELMKKAAGLAVELGFDGIDINMGCPDRSIEKQGAGAALIKNPKLAQNLITAAKEGAGDLPVSVKTRLGYNKNEIEEWLPTLLEMSPAAITIHARTRKEMSKVEAHWDQVARGVEIRNDLNPETLIVGNGGILTLDEAQKKIKETKADGVMLGKGIFGNPWLFNANIKEVTTREKLEVMLEHTKEFEELLGDVKNFAVMKKHYKAYVSGWDGAKELRVKLMAANNYNEVETAVRAHIENIDK